MESIVQASIYWGIFVALQSVIGFYLVQRNVKQGWVWALPLLSIVLSHCLFLQAHGIIRMLALIIPLLHSMKIIVANIHPKGSMSFAHWLTYYFLTVNMNPMIFAKKAERTVETKLLLQAFIHISIGASIIVFLRLESSRLAIESSKAAFFAYSMLALFSLSMILHFGILPINTFLLKLAGIADYPVFRQPFKSKSISEFWGRRWNLAFSEMTAIATFKPLSKRLGVKWASFISFMASGILHEVAISLSVIGGFGLPMLYFVIHGILMSIEKALFKNTAPGMLWVLASLILPLPLLFHEPFLKGVIWKLVWLGTVKE